MTTTEIVVIMFGYKSQYTVWTSNVVHPETPQETPHLDSL